MSDKRRRAHSTLTRRAVTRGNRVLGLSPASISQIVAHRAGVIDPRQLRELDQHDHVIWLGPIASI